MTSLPLIPRRPPPPAPRPGSARAARGPSRRRPPTGWATTMPCGSPSASRARITAATSRRCPPATARAARCRGRRTPASRPCRSPSTGTDSVSSRSRVAGTSRIDFTPAHTTVTGAAASAARSADSSQVSRAPRCTPPSPPVANTRMPASRARYAVAATVVAPVSPRASDRPEVADAGLHDALVLGDPHQRVVGEPDPDRAVDDARPSRAPLPPRRTASSICRAVAALVAVGRPWLMIVDSSATTRAPMQ